MKRLALAAVGAAVAGLTACSHATPSAAPGSNSAVTSSPAVTNSSAVTSSPTLSYPAVSAACRQQYDAWNHGSGKGLVAALSAIGSADTAGDTHLLTGLLKKAEPALTRAARKPMPACADPKGYWAVLLMHVNAAVASTRSASTLRVAMEGVPTLTQELNAELKSAGR